MGLRTLVIIISLTFYTTPNIAQSITDSNAVNLTKYKKIYHNVITTRAFFTNTSNTLKVKDRKSNQSFNLEPNKQDRIGLSLAFRSFNVSYSFAPDFISENKDNRNSKLFNLNLRTFSGQHLMQTFHLFNQKGFYIKNNEVNQYFPETKNFKIGGTTSYIFNENFSFKAISSQDEKQLKSTASFIPNITYYYSKFHLKDNSAFNNLDSSYYSLDIAFAPSYYYNYVPSKNLFLSVGISAGIGLNHSKSRGEDHLTTLLTELSFRGSANYDINNLYCGLHYSYLSLNHNADSGSQVIDNIPFFNIFVGYRFKAPKKFIKTAESINEMLKLKS
ncbi:DUF4421 family protein [Aestuariibaculum suncheonense]|uniref:DUF4421 family protein n=1 Tax=Aestuariibaculum suncheonense TaxID=1028745 RepID=A0A8J6QD49_9FLAO|nr:DUF4421 family protein [Aestuariibaculum suncheonense]MBD0833871.1 DUF4421 family protein [Aestuariibaculum suncheonense]